MIPVNLSDLRAAAPYRRPGYLAACESAAVKTVNGVLYLPDDAYAAIREKYATGMNPRPVQRIPAGFDIEQEARRAKQGGCCGSPSDG